MGIEITARGLIEERNEPEVARMLKIQEATESEDANSLVRQRVPPGFGIMGSQASLTGRSEARQRSALSVRRHGGSVINWDAVGAIGEIVGAAAVVITLLYLSVQLRQNTRTAKHAIKRGVYSDARGWQGQGHRQLGARGAVSRRNER